MEYEWTILKDGKNISSQLGKYGILLLNAERPLKTDPSVIIPLWTNATLRITVDGGTDLWLDYVKERGLQGKLRLPDQVTGDFDSIKPETLKYFQGQKSVQVIETPDQDYTDFHKAVTSLIKSSPVKLDSYIVLLENSGRLDQTFSNVNTLSMFDLPGYMLSLRSMTWLLRAGTHRIHIPPQLRDQEKICGILPFHQGATVWTSGLKWNLDNWKVEFGGLVSSSNTYDGSPIVTIKTDKTVIWTMSLDNLMLTPK